SRRMLKVRFPGVLNRAEQIKFLAEIENFAITTTELRLNNQVRAIEVWPQQLPRAVALLAIARDERVLEQMNADVRREAATGSNWEHQWSSSTHTYTSNAYNERDSWSLSPNLIHAFECAGAGEKVGCNWDGRKNTTLFTK
ncbi:MAG TPA: hypothetical protein VN605_12530, partial [Thermoanaerobaculia bacterium]|nr:hypothetical protein [Thermoanaerobaculia bacterium]